MKIQAIIETAIYVDDLDATEGFYRQILGLRVMGKEPGHHVFFVGAGCQLAIRPECVVLGHRGIQVLLLAYGVGGSLVDAVGQAVAES